jgi:Ca2+-binding EF-hand superfamily protein
MKTLPALCLLALLPVLRQDPAPRIDDRASDRTEEAIARGYFTTCDHDGNGWVSMREAERAMQVDRDGFAAFDTDRDGRIDATEFLVRYRSIVAMTGSFRPPESGEEVVPVPRRNAEQLRTAYDADRNGGLDTAEFRRVLLDYGREELPVELLLSKLDIDRSNRVDGEELENLSRLLSATHLPSLGADLVGEPEPRAGSIAELFGTPVERSTTFKAVSEPPRITGPVPFFLRLDLDRDGFVSEQELAKLGAPLELPVRIATVMAALDTNGDTRLSEAEFMRSM